MADYVFVLSGGHLSREIEHWLLWELPLCRGWQYYHAKLLHDGAKTVKIGADPVSRLKHFGAIVASRMKKRFLNPQLPR